MGQAWTWWKRQVARLKQETLALSLAYRDPRVPWYAKVFAAGVVAYAFSPLDLIPDFVPVLGYLDDLILVPLGLALALRMIPPEVMAESRIKAQEVLSQDRPTNWIAGAVVVAVWLLLAAVALALALRFVGR
jgi:uncharacterized membrane protein YkvA (DUF1232 family)